MDFPYSKERLHNLHEEHYVAEEKAYIKKIADYISQQIINKAIATSKKMCGGAIVEGTYEQRQIVFHFKHILKMSNRQLIVTRESLIPQIINELRIRFPDSVITIDPLATYIIVNFG